MSVLRYGQQFKYELHCRSPRPESFFCCPADTSHPRCEEFLVSLAKQTNDVLHHMGSEYKALCSQSHLGGCAWYAQGFDITPRGPHSPTLSTRAKACLTHVVRQSVSMLQSVAGCLCPLCVQSSEGASSTPVGSCMSMGASPFGFAHEFGCAMMPHPYLLSRIAVRQHGVCLPGRQSGCRFAGLLGWTSQVSITMPQPTVRRHRNDVSPTHLLSDSSSQSSGAGGLCGWTSRLASGKSWQAG